MFYTFIQGGIKKSRFLEIILFIFWLVQLTFCLRNGRAWLFLWHSLTLESLEFEILYYYQISTIWFYPEYWDHQVIGKKPSNVKLLHLFRIKYLLGKHCNYLYIFYHVLCYENIFINYTFINYLCSSIINNNIVI